MRVAASAAAEAANGSRARRTPRPPNRQQPGKRLAAWPTVPPVPTRLKSRACCRARGSAAGLELSKRSKHQAASRNRRRARELAAVPSAWNRLKRPNGQSRHAHARAVPPAASCWTAGNLAYRKKARAFARPAWAHGRQHRWQHFWLQHRHC
eukprot:9220717-Heterocapsa_arctica.AAC.1